MMQGMRGYENSSGWSGIKRRVHANASARVGRRRVSRISDERKAKTAPSFVLIFYTFFGSCFFWLLRLLRAVLIGKPRSAQEKLEFGKQFYDFTRPRGDLGRERARGQHGEHRRGSGKHEISRF
jgi:hypothetical protein